MLLNASDLVDVSPLALSSSTRFGAGRLLDLGFTAPGTDGREQGETYPCTLKAAAILEAEVHANAEEGDRYPGMGGGYFPVIGVRYRRQLIAMTEAEARVIGATEHPLKWF